MTGGSRSKSGCLTCRLRKKKCDEQRPVCESCHSRQLACYGYNTPLPSWATGKASWDEVRNSPEARNLRALAETRYKLNRKVQSRHNLEGAASDPLAGDVQVLSYDTSRTGQYVEPSGLLATFLAHAGTTNISNIWQLQPDTIWWDAVMSSLAVEGESSSQRETRLLMIFLDVIHPITHTFYHLSSGRDKSWLLNRIVNDRALFYAALSVSACFEYSLTQSTTINEIGIRPRVRYLQSASVARLRDEVGAYTASGNKSSQELVFEGVRLVDVVLNLLNLETFSMLQGCWEMHHHATRAILNHIELSTEARSGSDHDPNSSPIRDTIRGMPQTDERRRTLEFVLTNFVWIDTIATATFGLSSYSPCAFQYIQLLETEEIKPQDVMGCRGVLETIAEIARLEHWLIGQSVSSSTDTGPELASRYHSIAEDLRSRIEVMEGTDTQLVPRIADGIASDITRISIVWAYASCIYLEFVISNSPLPSAHMDQMLVETCLQKLEELPTRLILRVCWPYTIAGCMSLTEIQHQRFREVLARTMRERQAPGICWKGLIVMEECWRLRQMQGHASTGWRDAMASLDARILLV